MCTGQVRWRSHRSLGIGKLDVWGGLAGSGYLEMKGALCMLRGAVQGLRKKFLFVEWGLLLSQCVLDCSHRGERNLVYAGYVGDFPP